MLRKETSFKFAPQEIQASEKLKQILAEEPLLILQIFIQGQEIELHTDVRG